MASKRKHKRHCLARLEIWKWPDKNSVDTTKLSQFEHTRKLTPGVQKNTKETTTTYRGKKTTHRRSTCFLTFHKAQFLFSPMASTDVRRSIKPRPPIVGQSGSMFDTTRSVVLRRPGDHVPAAKLSVQQSTDFTGTKVTVRRTPSNFLRRGTADT